MALLGAVLILVGGAMIFQVFTADGTPLVLADPKAGLLALAFIGVGALILLGGRQPDQKR